MADSVEAAGGVVRGEEHNLSYAGNTRASFDVSRQTARKASPCTKQAHYAYHWRGERDDTRRNYLSAGSAACWPCAARNLYAHDVHFTRFGAFLCYQELMKSLPDCPPDSVVQEEQLTFRTALIAGDVARAYGSPARTVDWCDPPPVKPNIIVKAGTRTNSKVDVFETEMHDLPALVMFRTSNSTHLFPFLFRHFSRITAVSGAQSFFDLVESEAPQVVITEIAERMIAGRRPRWQGDPDLGSAPNDDAPSTFEQVTGLPLPLPRGIGQPNA